MLSALVIVYTKSTLRRPWVGRVTAKLDDDEFMIHWFGRQGKRKQFHALMEADGRPNTSAVSADSIMFWNIFENR